MKSNFGWGLLVAYNDLYIELIKSVFPEYKWLPWRFKKVPKGFWKDIKNQRDFMDWIGLQIGLKSMDDWYHVKIEVCYQLEFST